VLPNSTLLDKYELLSSVPGVALLVLRSFRLAELGRLTA